MSNWKDKLFQEMAKEYPNMDTVSEELYSTKEKEIGLVHPTLGTGMMLRNSGVMDMFADHNLGVKLNPKDNSLSVYASAIRLHTDNIIKVDYENKTYFTKEMSEIQKYVDK